MRPVPRTAAGWLFALTLACSRAAAWGPRRFLPRAPPRARRPFFNGWCIRTTDSEAGASTSLIIGSFSQGDRRYASHLIAVAVHAPDPNGGTRKLVAQQVLSGDGATIAVGEAGFRWSSDSGYMDYSATGIAYDFALPTSGGGTLRARAQVDLPADGHDRMAWPQGPEGWLGRVGWVLPCRYDINTLGSTASVAVAVKSAAGAEEKLIEQSTTARAHVESNHGRAFPASWVWVQAADGVGRSLIAVGGRFKIGFLTVPTWIVAYRAPTLNPEDDWSFRTTDVALTRCTSTRLSPPTAVGAEEASLRLTLQKKRRFDMLRWKSRRRQLVLELDVRADTLDFFQDRLNVPTPKGFSTTPGCAEAFGAAATVRAYVVQGGTRRLVDEATLRGAASNGQGQMLGVSKARLGSRGSPKGIARHVPAQVAGGPRVRRRAPRAGVAAAPAVTHSGRHDWTSCDSYYITLHYITLLAQDAP